MHVWRRQSSAPWSCYHKSGGVTARQTANTFTVGRFVVDALRLAHLAGGHTLPAQCLVYRNITTLRSLRVCRQGSMWLGQRGANRSRESGPRPGRTHLHFLLRRAAACMTYPFVLIRRLCQPAHIISTHGPSFCLPLQVPIWRELLKRPATAAGSRRIRLNTMSRQLFVLLVVAACLPPEAAFQLPSHVRRAGAAGVRHGIGQVVLMAGGGRGVEDGPPARQTR